MKKKYSIIYADPAWSYRDKASAGERGASFKYDVMSIEQIKALPVKDIAEDDCLLFLWVTFPMLQEGLDTIEAWGFKYKTMAFTWVKKNKKADSWFWGMGNWTRSNPEVCLLGVRGKPKRMSAKVHSIIDTPIEGHSKKPSVTREKITELAGGGESGTFCETESSRLGFMVKRNGKRHGFSRSCRRSRIIAFSL